jgi:hypothetical protein
MFFLSGICFILPRILVVLYHGFSSIFFVVIISHDPRFGVRSGYMEGQSVGTSKFGAEKKSHDLLKK